MQHLALERDVAHKAASSLSPRSLAAALVARGKALRQRVQDEEADVVARYAACAAWLVSITDQCSIVATEQRAQRSLVLCADVAEAHNDQLVGARRH